MSVLIKREKPKNADENQQEEEEVKGEQQQTRFWHSGCQPGPLVGIRMHKVGEFKMRIYGCELKCKDSFELTRRLRWTKHH